jgi:deoxycytidylate deaminase
MQRFARAFFGSNRVSPTKDEYGSYFAKAASLKTVDLSRQVGAAIFSQSGDIISTGCNDVAKPGGGHYWEEDVTKFRDIDIGSEANKEETSRIIFDFLKTLQKNNALSGHLTAEAILADKKIRAAIGESMIGEITEYGRMIHAEMSALSDAARLGRIVKDSTLYVTTYHCHNCAKHIVSSGVSRVVYIEPYPKSRAKSLYGHAISENKNEGLVSFEHFYGISPRLYRTIFEKDMKRRDSSGKVVEWVSSVPKPLVRRQDYDLAELEVRQSLGRLIVNPPATVAEH